MVGLYGGGRLAPFKFLLFVSFLGCYFFGHGSTLRLISLSLSTVWFCVNSIESVVNDYEFCKRLDEKRVEEEETSLTSFTMSESDSNEDDDGSANEDGDDDYNGDHDEDGDEIFEAELEDLELEEEDSDNDEDMEEDDIDPDELSYEDLIALGEIVGSENNGLSTDEIASYLCPFAYKSQTECKYGVDQCVVCQTEYEEEEPVTTLPCDHTYHLECISKWLQIKKVCPICNSEVSSSALYDAHYPYSTPYSSS
ncbi:zinc finger protein [Macleaya cordata]|uniref:Zinc finger protein n=1 Tax=Macleaya cordata TaxID=56857 RepID=A0A200Q6S9_MACCD|nr:zinc finger protein [Macleaya cordata]